MTPLVESAAVPVVEVEELSNKLFDFVKNLDQK